MKSFLRWSKSLCLIGGTVLGALLAGSLPALALTDAEVMQRLQSVPVFAITDAEGSPLVAAPSETESGSPVAGVFISRQDAQTFLDNLTAANPDLASDVHVAPVSLAEVYQLATSMRDQENRLEFVFVPMQQQVETAVTILRQANSEVDSFEGVPLFIARSDEGEGSYLTIRQGEQEVVPMFFSQEDLQAMLNRLQEAQPDLASTMSIQVINLEGLIDTLQSSDNPDLNSILLVPPRESLEFIQGLQEGQPPAENGASPAAPENSGASQLAP